ncbi:MAG: rod shape-determining protein MreD [Acidobacteria bacterium]|nr:rod shape-determining protein MreD [Acidobacteriota bacterium]
MTILRFAGGLVIAVAIHATLNKVAPGSLVYFNPYVILVTYQAMRSGSLAQVIALGALAGLVQDAFSISLAGANAFALTLCGYAVAFINAKLVLRGNASFGACLAGSTFGAELIVWTLTSILVETPIPFAIDIWLARTLVTALFGLLLLQSLRLVLGADVVAPGQQRRRDW